MVTAAIDGATMSWLPKDLEVYNTAITSTTMTTMSSTATLLPLYLALSTGFSRCTQGYSIGLNHVGNIRIL
jgi:hypothetical protein